MNIFIYFMFALISQDFDKIKPKIDDCVSNIISYDKNKELYRNINLPIKDFILKQESDGIIIGSEKIIANIKYKI